MPRGRLRLRAQSPQLASTGCVCRYSLGCHTHSFFSTWFAFAASLYMLLDSFGRAPDIPTESTCAAHSCGCLASHCPRHDAQPGKSLGTLRARFGRAKGSPGCCSPTVIHFRTCAANRRRRRLPGRRKRSQRRRASGAARTCGRVRCCFNMAVLRAAHSPCLEGIQIAVSDNRGTARLFGFLAGHAILWDLA